MPIGQRHNRWIRRSHGPAQTHQAQSRESGFPRIHSLTTISLRSAKVLDAIAARGSPELHGRGELERIRLQKFGQNSGCGLRLTRLRRPSPCFRTCSVATRDVFRMDSCGPCRDGFVIGAVSNCTVQRWIVSSHLLAWPEWNQPRCRVLEPCRAVRAKGAGRATGAGTAQRPQRIH